VLAYIGDDGGGHQETSHSAAAIPPHLWLVSAPDISGSAIGSAYITELSESEQIATIRTYFAKLNASDMSLLDLFTEDVELYFPKFGIGRGKDQMLSALGGVMQSLERITHDLSSLAFIEEGPRVAVEGCTSGVTSDGTAWVCRETPGGRFCSVFTFADGRIARMHIYLDLITPGRIPTASCGVARDAPGNRRYALSTNEKPRRVSSTGLLPTLVAGARNHRRFTRKINI
jgi:ketosteroid isomerase-like protein